jgi:hypothetical protein
MTAPVDLVNSRFTTAGKSTFAIAMAAPDSKVPPNKAAVPNVARQMRPPAVAAKTAAKTLGVPHRLAKSGAMTAPPAKQISGRAVKKEASATLKG